MPRLNFQSKSRLRNLSTWGKAGLGALLVVGVLVILGLVKGAKIYIAMSGQNFGPPPEAVSSMVVQSAPWERRIDAVGSLIPSEGVTLAAEEPGRVVKINFESGDEVSAGAVLVELDSSVEEARLRGAEAMLKRAREEWERAKTLRQKSAMSESDMQRAQAESANAEAEVESLRATIARKKILAPFAGRAGIRMVNVGGYLIPGDAVVPLHVLNPLFLNFTLAQRDADEVHGGEKVEITVDATEEWLGD